VAVANERFHRETTQIATLPNLLTIIRLILVIPFAWFLLKGADGVALGIFFVAGLTDILDGQIARWLGQTSKWGRLVDPIADKLLTCVAYVVLSLFRSGLPAIPMWVTIAVLSRDVVILVGAGVVYASVRSTGFKPTLFGKLNTVIELGVVCCFLAATATPGLRPFLNPLYWLLLISIVVSGGDYVVQGARMLRK
jgi:cardiolipin synthase (CMP-forming)